MVRWTQRHQLDQCRFCHTAPSLFCSEDLRPVVANHSTWETGEEIRSFLTRSIIPAEHALFAQDDYDSEFLSDFRARHSRQHRALLERRNEAVDDLRRSSASVLRCFGAGTRPASTICTDTGCRPYSGVASQRTSSTASVYRSRSVGCRNAGPYSRPASVRRDRAKEPHPGKPVPGRESHPCVAEVVLRLQDRERITIPAQPFQMLRKPE